VCGPEFPFVALTSNEAREFPRAFLRRSLRPGLRMAACMSGLAADQPLNAIYLTSYAAQASISWPASSQRT
jgi:hypothetical protein